MLVIGNGESRTSVDIDKLNGTKIGCNAILRDYKVDYLVCVDKRMLTEALNSSYHKHATIYTRHDWWIRSRLEPNLRAMPKLPFESKERYDQPWHWGAGPYAVLLACTLSDDIKLIGFDLYGNNGKVNNVYKDTANYNMSHKRAVDPRYWIHQIGTLFSLYTDKQFTIYQDNWRLPETWNYSNVKVDKISKLV
jgi:hypothetical protein